MQVCAPLPSCAPAPAAEARGLAAERRLPARDDRGQPQHAPDHRAGGHGGAGAAARRLGRRGAGAAGADDHLGGGHDRRRRRAGDDDARRPRRCARRPPRRAAPPDPRLPAEAARAVAQNELYSAETRDLAAATAGLLETRGKRPLPCTLRPAPSAAPAPALRSARWCQTAVAPAAWCERRLKHQCYLLLFFSVCHRRPRGARSEHRLYCDDFCEEGSHSSTSCFARGSATNCGTLRPPCMPWLRSPDFHCRCGTTVFQQLLRTGLGLGGGRGIELHLRPAVLSISILCSLFSFLFPIMMMFFNLRSHQAAGRAGQPALLACRRWSQLCNSGAGPVSGASRLPGAQPGPSTRSSRSSSSSTGTSPGGSIWQLSPSPTVRTRTSPPACAARSRCRKLS